MVGKKDTSAKKKHRHIPLGRKRSAGRLVRLARCEEGSALVEFAMVIPIFVLFLTGIVQFGMVLFLQSHMSDVARDVSRRLAVGDLSATEAVVAAESSLINWGIDYSVQVIEPDPSDPDDKDMTVSISAPMEQAAMFDLLGILEGSTLAASVTMRLEG